jgi:hypothetical protein
MGWRRSVALGGKNNAWIFSWYQRLAGNQEHYIERKFWRGSSPIHNRSPSLHIRSPRKRESCLNVSLRLAWIFWIIYLEAFPSKSCVCRPLVALIPASVSLLFYENWSATGHTLPEHVCFIEIKHLLPPVTYFHSRCFEERKEEFFISSVSCSRRRFNNLEIVESMWTVKAVVPLLPPQPSPTDLERGT